MAATASSSSSALSPAWADPNPPTARTSIQQQLDDDDEGQNMLLEPYSTLDEPVLETILRDVRAVGSKLRVVLLPLDRTAVPFGYSTVQQQQQQPSSQQDDGGGGGNQQQQQQQQLTVEELTENEKKVLDRLKDWDLWGPLVVCLAMSVLLSFRAPTNQASMVFAAVFVSVWVGSAVVTVNAQLLGSHISFFQSVCVMGYCVFPMMVSAFIVGLFKLTPLGKLWLLDLIWIAVGFVWATRASTVFMGQYICREKRALAVFPVIFYYIFLGWLILLF